MRLHNGRADLQPRLAPFPIAATGATRKREYLTELFRVRGQRRLKRRREVRLGFIQCLVEQDVEIQRQISAGVAATAVKARQFVKTNGCRVTAGGIEEHSEIFTGEASEVEQSGGIQFPTRALVDGQRFYVAGNQSVRPAQFQRFNPFVADICSGFGFLIDEEGHSFYSGLPPEI